MTDAHNTLEKLYTALNAHDVEAVARQRNPEIRFDAPGVTMTRDEAKLFDGNLFAAFPDARIVRTKVTDAGSTLVVEGTFMGTHRGTFRSPLGDATATGNPVNVRYCHLVHVGKDGFVDSERLYFDPLEFFVPTGAVTLPPSPAQ